MPGSVRLFKRPSLEIISYLEANSKWTAYENQLKKKKRNAPFKTKYTSHPHSHCTLYDLLLLGCLDKSQGVSKGKPRAKWKISLSTEMQTTVLLILKNVQLTEQTASASSECCQSLCRKDSKAKSTGTSKPNLDDSLSPALDELKRYLHRIYYSSHCLNIIQ